MAIKVFLADDHAIVREGLRSLLESSGKITVVGEAVNGEDAMRQVRKILPDVVLMDITMPGLNGIIATRRIKESHPEIKVVMLSMHSGKEHVFRALEAGAMGYLLKESAGIEVLDAIAKVHSGHRYLSQKILDWVTEDAIKGRAALIAQSPLGTLTNREKEILQMVVEGDTSAQIAEKLFISPKTVETHRSRIMEKLGIRNLPDLVKFAIRHGVTTI